MGRASKIAVGLCFLIVSCVSKDSADERKSTISQTQAQETTIDNSSDYATGEKDRTFEEMVASYERPDRINWQKPMEVLSFLGNDLGDKVVAEIGAGSGYFTFRMVPLVEKVIAIDINDRMLAFIDSCTTIYLPDSIQGKIETRLADRDDPKIEKNEVDVIFLSNTYGFIDNRISYFKSLKASIRPGGRLVIVDYKRRRIPVGPTAEFKIPLYQVEDELRAAGYKETYANDLLLPYQYIVVAVPD